MSYVFMTDTNSDIPFTVRDALSIPLVYMPYALDGKEYFADLGENGEDKVFYAKMRSGVTPVTSALPKDVYLDYFEPILKEQDLLFLAFSSALSATYQSIMLAREELLKKYPHRVFRVVDTLSICGPELVLILAAHKLYSQGKPLDEVGNWVEANRLHSHAWFTVDDLVYLKRGGRVSGAAAFLGTMLQLKPVLCLSKEGKLTPADKVRGRKSALKYIVDKTVDLIENADKQQILVLHADAEDEARQVVDQLRERVPNISSIELMMIGPVIGTHCGPGTICVSFLGKERTM